MHPRRALLAALGVAFASHAVADSARAQQPADREALAKQLVNPVADLISVPFQLNYDDGFGPGGDGSRWLLNVQPVVPFHLNEDWNLISRTIVPFADVEDFAPGAGSESGLGDIVQSFFFSPQQPTDSGWILGAGPVFLLPTASEDALGTGKFGVGPTAVALRQQGPWTYGGLVNHIVSVGGDGDREDVDATFLQPFTTYTTPTAWTFGINSESTRDWENEEWSIPVNLFASKLVVAGDTHMSVGGGLRYWVDAPDNGPDGLGFRLFVTLLF